MRKKVWLVAVSAGLSSPLGKELDQRRITAATAFADDRVVACEMTIVIDAHYQ